MMRRRLPKFPPEIPLGRGREVFTSGGYKSSPQGNMDLKRRLYPYVEDERKANVDYEHEADFAYAVGRPDIAATLEVMSEDEHRHHVNLLAMMKDLR